MGILNAATQQLLQQAQAQKAQGMPQQSAPPPFQAAPTINAPPPSQHGMLAQQFGGNPAFAGQLQAIMNGQGYGRQPMPTPNTPPIVPDQRQNQPQFQLPSGALNMPWLQGLIGGAGGGF
jgi:hypothetical protein